MDGCETQLVSLRCVKLETGEEKEEGGFKCVKRFDEGKGIEL